MSAGAAEARVFLALALGAELGARVAAAARAALGGDAAERDFRLPRAEGLHATLHFLGDVERARLAGLEAELARPLAGLAAPSLRLAAGGAFPDRRRPRVLWIGVEERARPGALLACRRAVLDAVRAAGLLDPGSREPFHPHVTVARPRAARALPASFAGLRLDLDWDPREVVLMESRTAPGGSRYEVLARRALERAE